jgi:hypothetical protein
MMNKAFKMGMDIILALGVSNKKQNYRHETGGLLKWKMSKISCPPLPVHGISCIKF